MKRACVLVWSGFLVLALGEAQAQEPPDDFTGTAPLDNGSLVVLKDGRLMMVGSGTSVSYSSMVRASKEVGELPARFGLAHYPNAHFVKDHVFITFGVREGLRLHGDKVEMMPGQRKLMIRPIKWLYEE